MFPTFFNAVDLRRLYHLGPDLLVNVQIRAIRILVHPQGICVDTGCMGQWTQERSMHQSRRDEMRRQLDRWFLIMSCRVRKSWQTFTVPLLWTENLIQTWKLHHGWFQIPQLLKFLTRKTWHYRKVSFSDHSDSTNSSFIRLYLISHRGPQFFSKTIGRRCFVIVW